ncbi:MAG: SUMF1/EgtB/PvdO family nonheme iron enzyme [Bacteroidetes bacterium]|nr:SUMF1/EgtB/PvdO family nonheme iron enzyme [Bacteroidota bacterium]
MSHDIFISFKNLDSKGKQTRDSKLAKELYDYLTESGYTVFFSNESIKKTGTSQYKKAINDALDTSSILIVVGTSKDHIESEQVKFEWESFYDDILNLRKPVGQIYSYIDGMSIEELPRPLRIRQAFIHSNKSKENILGFIRNALGENPSPSEPIVDPKIFPQKGLVKLLLFVLLAAAIIYFWNPISDIFKSDPDREMKNMEMINGGLVTIGQSGINSDNPSHNVTLSPFWIDKNEVTVGEYLKYCKEQNIQIPADPNFPNMPDYFTDPKWSNYPVVNISWFEAKLYCERQNKRLPTEAEWESAARNSENNSTYQFLPFETNYPDSSILEYFPDYQPVDLKNDKFPFTSPVGTFKANHNNVFDLNGNVSEWCLDGYEKNYYRESTEFNPVNIDSTLRKAVVRGPSWLTWDNGNVAKRNRRHKNHKYREIGFRCVKRKK